MLNRLEDYETLAMVVFGFLFLLWEKFSPARPHNRLQQIRFDVIALITLAVSINIARPLIHEIFRMPMISNLWVLFEPLKTLPSGVKIFGVVLCVDFNLYWIHRWMHVSRTLWRTHDWHHSAAHLYWFSGYRTSFMHAFLYAIVQIFFAYFVFHLTFNESLVAFAILGIFSQVWTHANITVPMGPLEKLLITPQYHRLHHAKGRTMRTNYGVFFPWWDMLFGTYEDPRTHNENYPLGLNAARPTWKRLLGI
jgi:sterol desaturase/sphingolipid hydroxylase (fatty acid hydroxylase superfamily)